MPNKCYDSKSGKEIPCGSTPDFNGYKAKADTYLKRSSFKGSGLTGEVLARNAEKVYNESGVLVPIDLVLTQGQFETNLGTKLKSKNNYWNVGNTDDGSTKNYDSPDDSAYDYMKLIQKDYLQDGKKSVDDLTKNYVNSDGNRYASDPNYEKKLSDQMKYTNSFINKNLAVPSPYLAPNPTNTPVPKTLFNTFSTYENGGTINSQSTDMKKIIKMADGGMLTDEDPKPRKVKAIPTGYNKRGNTNIYDKITNTASSGATQGSGTGTNMDNAAWLDFISKNPNWKSQNNTANQTIDSVYMDDAPAAPQIKPVSAMDGTRVFDNNQQVVGSYQWITRQGDNNLKAAQTSLNDPNQMALYQSTNRNGVPVGEQVTIPANYLSNKALSGYNHLYNPEVIDKAKKFNKIDFQNVVNSVAQSQTMEMGGSIVSKTKNKSGGKMMKYEMGTQDPIDPNDPFGIKKMAGLKFGDSPGVPYRNSEPKVPQTPQTPQTPQYAPAEPVPQSLWHNDAIFGDEFNAGLNDANPTKDFQRAEDFGGSTNLGKIQPADQNKNPNLKNIEWGVTTGLTAVNKILGDIDTKKRERVDLERAVKMTTFNPTYNPYSYGNGSQAIMEDGGSIDGGAETQVLGGGRLEQISDSTVSNPMMEAKGNTHDEGGIDIMHGKNKANIEKNEIVWKDDLDRLHVFGKLKMPGTNETFKTVAKNLAKQESTVDKNKSKALNIINNTDPKDKYAGSAFETAKVMFMSHENEAKEIAMKKQELAGYQSAILNMTTPQTQKAEFGISIPKFATGGVLSPDEANMPPSIKAKFDKAAADVEAALRAKYPGKDFKVVGSGDRAMSTQRGLKGSGASKTSASLHNFSGATDFAIYVDGKLQDGKSNESSAYYNEIAPVAKANGLSTIGSWDKSHVTVVPEGGKSPGGAFKNLLKQYPELVQDKNYQDNFTYLDNLVKTGKADGQEINAWQQLSGKKSTTNAINVDYSKYAKEMKSPGANYTRLGENYFQNDVTQKIPQRGNDVVPFSVEPKPGTTGPQMPYDPNAVQPKAETKATLTYDTPPMTSAGVTIDNTNRKRDMSSPLDIRQVTPEILTLASNQRNPVEQMMYQPDLKQTFDMSYQLGRNENQSTFNQVAKIAGDSGNIDSLYDLAAQKYKGDESYNMAEVQNNAQQKLGVYGQNTDTLNDAKLRNIQAVGVQQDKIAQGKYYQRKELIDSVGSIDNKSLLNTNENKTYNAYGNLFPDYGFDSRGNVTFDRKNAVRWQSGSDNAYLAAHGKSTDSKTITTEDGNGNVKKVSKIDDDLSEFNTIWNSKSLSEPQKKQILSSRGNSIFKGMN